MTRQPDSLDVSDMEVARFALRTFQATCRSYWDQSGSYESRGTDYLTSVFKRGLHWDGGVCKAVCQVEHPMEGETSGHHEAPAEKCHCGIYGTLNLAHLMSQYPHDAANIVTVIAAEGNTILGSRGLRTAYARVVGYWSPVPEIRSIAERQFYDARFFEDIDEMLAHFELPTGWPDQEDAFTVELMTGERLTAPTPQQIAKAYTNALGGESTWVTLRNGGKAVGGPMESKLKTAALGSVTWEEVEIPVEPFNGEVMVCMSAGPDEPVVDMVSVGHFTFTDKGSIHISPKFNVTFG